jgi:hypothetical protein
VPADWTLEAKDSGSGLTFQGQHPVPPLTIDIIFEQRGFPSCQTGQTKSTRSDDDGDLSWFSNIVYIDWIS